MDKEKMNKQEKQMLKNIEIAIQIVLIEDEMLFKELSKW